MNKKQRFAVVVILFVASIVGTCTAVNAESIYLPLVKNNYVNISVRFTECGNAVVGGVAQFDIYDGLPRFPVVTDENGLANWQGINNSPTFFLYILDGSKWVFETFAITHIDVESCDGVIKFIPEPVG